MKDNTIKTRDEISKDYKWDIEAMYPVEDDVNKDIQEGIELSESLAAFQGHIMDSPSNLLKVLDTYASSMQKIEKAYVYAHMKHDEDNSNSKYNMLYSKAMSSIATMSANTSFITPELLTHSEDEVMSFVDQEQGLSKYRFMLENILLKQPHTLSAEQEYVMASLSEALNAPDDIFSALNDVDMVFGEVENDEGLSTPLTHATYSILMESKNREVREETFVKLYEKYKEHNNTLATTYNYNVKTNAISCRLRNYNSCLEAALSGNKIPVSVYHNLIDAVHKHLPAMHSYVGIRKRVLGLDDLKMYDVYRPLVKPANAKYSFKEAVDICCKALAPMGEEYVSVFRDGILNKRWVDIYENKGKTSGAYSFGSYDSYPYILMNFAGELRDVFTLIHEGGHSMHSYYTRKTQDYIYGDHCIFTAEVASTVNETLLIKYLLDNTEDKEMRTYLVNFYIDEFKSTLFRQTMFAEFEKWAHEQVEAGEALTAESLNAKYAELNALYFGPEMGTDEYIQYEWSRIPHFYRAFYVYQYATGYSAANAIANRILSLGKEAVDDYIKFLSLGSSDYPIELLKIAGVDMSTEEPVLSALDTFDELIKKLNEMI